MDIVDITTERDEYLVRHRIAICKKPEGPPANGNCIWCGHPAPEPNAKFCSKSCEEDYEKDLKFSTMRGRS